MRTSCPGPILDGGHALPDLGRMRPIRGRKAQGMSRPGRSAPSGRQALSPTGSYTGGLCRAEDTLIADVAADHRAEAAAATAPGTSGAPSTPARQQAATSLNVALATLRDEAQMLDLYPAAKVKAQHTGAQGGPIQHEVSARP